MKYFVYGDDKFIVAFVSDETKTLYISRRWAKYVGIKTIKIAEGSSFGEKEHRV